MPERHASGLALDEKPHDVHIHERDFLQIRNNVAYTTLELLLELLQMLGLKVSDETNRRRAAM